MASVHQSWMANLPLQQQSVIALAMRGPDGETKHTPFKKLLRAYRGTVLVAAKYGRPLEFGEKADDFMTLHEFAEWGEWKRQINEYLENDGDAAILHHYSHFMHGAEIIGYKHPDRYFADRWRYCYEQMVAKLHLRPEPEDEMDARLSDWGRKHWEVEHWEADAEPGEHQVVLDALDAHNSGEE